MLAWFLLCAYFMWTCCRCYSSTSLSHHGAHSSYLASYFKWEILPIKLHFIGVRSFSCKMVHWLHSLCVLLIHIHLQPDMPVCRCVALCACVWKREEMRSCQAVSIMYCNLLTRWPHPNWSVTLWRVNTYCVCASVCTEEPMSFSSWDLLTPLEWCVRMKVTSSLPVCKVILVTTT